MAGRIVMSYESLRAAGPSAVCLSPVSVRPCRDCLDDSSASSIPAFRSVVVLICPSPHSS